MRRARARGARKAWRAAERRLDDTRSGRALRSGVNVEQVGGARPGLNARGQAWRAASQPARFARDLGAERH